MVPLAIVPLLIKNHQPDTPAPEAPKAQPAQEPASHVTEQPSTVDGPTSERSHSVKNQDSPKSRVLANTGADVAIIAGLALVLIASALVLLWPGRRKES
ncbi:hypothetical protein HMPREF2698_04220 [Corynebacterium sp. HMSC072A02]|nr:hypothetical protein HMPREF2698_04220 [Corynebacterium sp. HMSC072A02]